MDQRKDAHAFDLEGQSEELELFAEEVRGSQQHDLPPNTLSTFACECDISTFFCYGCSSQVASRPDTTKDGQPMTLGSPPLDDPGDFETALKWARDKMKATPDADKVSEVFHTLFRKK